MPHTYNINIITDAPNDSTSFYRAWGVFNQIYKKTVLPINLLEEARFGWNTVGKYCLLYIHRANNNEHYQAIVIAKKNGIPIWVDYDDDLTSIPIHNKSYGAFKDKKDIIKNILSLADVITVSTQALKDNYISALQAGGSKITVIENFIPYDNIPFAPPQKKSKFRVLWRGSNTHEVDWITHKDAFIEFIKGKKNIKFINIGDMPLTIKMDIAKYCEVEDAVGRKLIDYLLWLRTGVADVIFVPLEDTPFSRAKSDIAVQEGLVGGMASVAPSWNTELSDFAYTNSPLDALNSAYHEWNEKYDNYKELIILQQSDMKRLYSERFTKRVDLIKKTLHL